MKVITYMNIRTIRILGILFMTLVLSASCETSSLSELAEERVSVDDNPVIDDGDEESEEQSNLVTYENRARLILDNACVECHNSITATAGIRLDNFSFARDVAESGRMIARMTSQSNPMPPSGNLPDSIIEDILQWIDDGLLEN